MYAIIRGDLNMAPGKLASQAGHAFKILTRQLVINNPALADEYFSDGDIGTNVVLKAKNLNYLERAISEAKSEGLPCCLIMDSGHILPPHFDGSPIVTAIGIGPCRKHSIYHIVKRFSCVL